MKIYKKFFLFAFVLVVVFALGGKVFAMTPVLSLSTNGSSDNVIVNVTGDSNSSIIFYYNNTYGTQNRILGSTDNNGFFSTLLSTSNYGITSGTTVYVRVNNQQSISVIWPYSNTSVVNNNTGLNISSLTLNVGDLITLSSANGSSFYVSNNSNPLIASTSFGSLPLGCTSGSQYSVLNGSPCYLNTNYLNNSTITIQALSFGTNTIVLCQNNNNTCNSINILVNNTNTFNSNNNYSNINQGVTNCYFSRSLRFGMSGSDVACLQSFLLNKGYLVNSNNSLNSYFDLETQNAVMLFQRDNYLGVDGVVGRRTRERIY